MSKQIAYWLNPSERKVAPEMQMKTWRANSNPQTDILCEQYNVPLYTHPQKELTDEEILEVYKDVFNWFSTHDDDKQVKQFARAILKKASTK
jgi:hypothetical protein